VGHGESPHPRYNTRAWGQTFFHTPNIGFPGGIFPPRTWGHRGFRGLGGYHIMCSPPRKNLGPTSINPSPWETFYKGASSQGCLWKKNTSLGFFWAGGFSPREKKGLWGVPPSGGGEILPPGGGGEWPPPNIFVRWQTSSSTPPLFLHRGGAFPPLSI